VLFPTLYRTFAQIDSNEESFLEFANWFGELGVGMMTERSGPIHLADPSHRWFEERHTMREAVDVLDALKDEDDATLSKWFNVSSNGAQFQRQCESGAGHWAWVAIPG